MPNAFYNHELEPENYYMPRQVNGDTIWDQEVQVETGYPAGTAVITRRCKYSDTIHGYQMVQASPDVIAVRSGPESYNTTAVYQQWVHAEVWNETHSYWERPQPISKQSTVLYQPIFDEDGNVISYGNRVVGVEYTADFGLGNYLKTIINYNWFTGQANKHTYYFYWPGVKKRVYTQLQIYDITRFNMDISDFDGPTEIIEQAGLTNIIYYPDGVTEDACEVDPYLGVEEQSTYIEVAADGWKMRINTDTQSSPPPTTAVIDEIDGTFSPTAKVNIVNTLNINGYIYTLGYDQSKVVEIIENGSNRVITKTIGRLRDAGNFDYPGIVQCIVYLVIYDDLIIVDHEMITNASLPLNDDNGNAFVKLELLGAQVTGEAGIREDAGSELSASNNTTYNTAKFLGFRSNEINAIGISLYDSFVLGTATWRQYVGGLYGNYLGPNNGTLLAGTHRQIAAICIDARKRESDGGTFTAWATATDYVENDIVIESNLRYICKVDHTSGVFATDLANGYWLEYRIELANQYKDQTIGALTTGIKVTDTVVPHLMSGDMTSDGAFPLELQNKEIEFNWDINRIKPINMIYDPVFQTGDPSNPTNYLVGHWKMNDNDPALSVIAATVGRDGILVGGKNTSQASSVDAIKGTSLITDGTVDIIDLSVALQDLSSFQKFSILFIFKPAFNYLAGSSERLLGIFNAWNDYIAVIYNSGGKHFQVDEWIGGTYTGTQIGKVFTSQREFECWQCLLLSINLEQRRIFGHITGEAFSLATTANNWLGTPDELHLGHNQNSFGNYYFDDTKLFNDCLLKYGAGVWKGNGEVTSESYHSDINSFVKGNEANNDPLKIGTGNITVTNASYGEDVQGNLNSALRIETGFTTIVKQAMSNLSPDKGQISFWFKQTVDVSDSCFFYSTYSVSNLVLSRVATGDNLAAYVGGILVIPSTAVSDIWDGNWHYIVFTYNQSTGIVSVEIDGVVEIISSPTGFSLLNTNGEFNIGHTEGVDRYVGGYICDFQITNNPATPKNFSMFGKELHLPYFVKDNALLKMKTDYLLDWNLRGNLVFKDEGLVNGD